MCRKNYVIMIKIHHFDLFLFQEEFDQLINQLNALREKNLRLGNRHLAEKIAAMQEMSKRGVWSTNVDKKQTIAGDAGYAFTNHQLDCSHPTVEGGQKSLVINQTAKKTFTKDVTV